MIPIEHFNFHFLNYMNRFLSNSFKVLGVIALITISTFSVVNAQSNIEDVSKKTMNLEQAIQIALANNTQMKRSLLTVQDAAQQIRSAWSNVMPTIAASANYTRNLEVPVNFIPAILFDPSADPDQLSPVAFGTDNSWQGGFTVSQTIFSGQAFVGISASELYKTAQNENLRATAQGIVTQTRISYYQALVAKEKVELIKAQIERIRKNLADTKVLLEQGYADEYSVLQLEVQLSNIEPQLIKSEYELKNSYQQILDVMGLPVQLSIGLKGDLGSFNVDEVQTSSSENVELKNIDTLIPLTLSEDSAFTKQALNLRGDIRILDVQKSLQQKQLIANRSTYLPSIVANYNLSWSASQPGNPIFFGTEENRARSQTVSLGVQIPLFQGFQRDAAIQQSKIEIKDTQLQLFQAKQTANKEIYSATQGLREALQTSDALKKALNQANTGYERAVIRNRNGIGSQQELNDAELQLQQAEINYAQMVSGYLTAKALYDQAIGQVPYVGENIQKIKENIELK